MRRLLLAALLSALAVPARAAEPPAPRRDLLGDPLPAGAVARMGTVRLGTPGNLTSITFTPDSKTLLAVGPGQEVHRWEAATGRPLPSLPAPGTNGNGIIRCSADGKTFIVEGRGSALCFLDAASGKRPRIIVNEGLLQLVGLDVARDGKTLLLVDQSGRIAIWDVAESGVRHYHQGPRGFPLAALLPDGKQAVVANPDYSLHLIDTASGKAVRSFDMPPAPPGAPAARLQRLALSADGKTLAFAGPGAAVTLCSVETGKQVRTLNLSGTIQALAFSPSSRFLAVSAGFGVHLYGVASGKELRHLEGASPAILAFAPDGKSLAAIGPNQRINLWDLADAQPLHTVAGHHGLVQQLLFLPDGKRLVSVGLDGQTILWDATTGQHLAARRTSMAPTNGNGPTLTADGKAVRMLGFNRYIYFWGLDSDHAERQQVLTLPFGSPQSLSPDGKTVALCSQNKLTLYDLDRGGAGRPLDAPATWMQMLLFSPDSRLLLATGNDGVIRVWERATGKLVRSLGDPMNRVHVQHLSFSPDGRCLLIFDGTLRVVEVATGQNRLQMSLPGIGVSALAWSADGRLIARGGTDGKVTVCSLATGQEMTVLKGQQGSIGSLVFSTDGRRLASGGMDGTILVWDLPAEEPIKLAEREADAMWRALGDRDAVRAGFAVMRLAGAPEQAVPLIRERLANPARPPSAEQIARLIADLDSDSFTVRERASQELSTAGPAAADALKKALAADPSPEARRRIEELLDRMQKGGLAPEKLRGQRAVEVLERIGTPAARKVLEELQTKASEPELKEDIRASLTRLGSRP
jgi:WD40 repeat protein